MFVVFSYPDKDFIRTSPEAQGIRSIGIINLLKDIRETGIDVHSLLIMRHGRLIHEQYFAPYTKDTKHSMYSCSKTFTSMLVGIACDKELIKLSDKVVSFFPEELSEIKEPNEYLLSMTIEDLLMMGSGHGEDTFGYMMAQADKPDADFVRIFLNRPVDHKPGTHFVYNTGATYMCAAILQKVTGKRLIDLANEWLFDSLGIEGAYWDTCPKGIAIGGSGLHILPTDMLRLGMMIMEHGRWKNEQLVSRSYIAAAQKKHIENRSGDPKQDHNWAAGYGYQMWRCDFDCFRADGMGGQYIVMIPRLDMIVVITSAMGDPKPMGYLLDEIETILLPEVYENTQCVSVDDTAELQALSAVLEKNELTEKPEDVCFPFGKKLTLSENKMKYNAVTVTENDVTIETAQGDIKAEYGWNGYKNNEHVNTYWRWNNFSDLAAKATWEDGVLHIRLQYVGEPFTTDLWFTGAGESMKVKIRSFKDGSDEAECAL